MSVKLVEKNRIIEDGGVPILEGGKPVQPISILWSGSRLHFASFAEWRLFRFIEIRVIE